MVYSSFNKLRLVVYASVRNRCEQEKMIPLVLKGGVTALRSARFTSAADEPGTDKQSR
jgi:hypothetical protein